MRARFERAWAKASRANLAASVGVLLALSKSHSAAAALASPQRRQACMPDVYCLCAGEIPKVRALTNCLRQKASLSEPCQAVFEQ
jgi:20S proteasome alpha/beta subunit